MDANGRETEPVYDPATGEVIAETPLPKGRDVDRVVKVAAENMKVGPGYEEDSELTPLIRGSHREKVKSYVDLGEEEGATVALDGRELPLDEGFFFRPTILDNVTGGMRVAREEISARSSPLCGWIASKRRCSLPTVPRSATPARSTPRTARRSGTGART
jgi:acyl-CoA reductase-like NAD-dependent aldehyde dehydrogenase